MRALVLLVLLAGCAAPHGCKTVTVTKTNTVTVDRYIVVHDQPHTILLSDYAQTLSAEKPIVLHSKAPAINKLIALNNAARRAFAPIERPHHQATPAEITNAMTALGALQVYVSSQRHP